MTKSIKNIALIVTLGTLISKFSGLLRQLVIAFTFGIGPAYEAYNYAYIIPGFFLVLLGGVNGPFHNAMVTVLSKKSDKEKDYLLYNMNLIITSLLIIITIILFFGSNLIIKCVGPGLSPEINKMAVQQLKIMSPIILLSGLIGIGFGSLNSRNKFLIPSIAPIMSSISIILIIGIFFIIESTTLKNDIYNLKGGYLLALATLIGAFLQWFIQLNPRKKCKFQINNFKLKLNEPGIKKILQILWPATFSSGMLQINVFIDLFFASAITGAASGLSYANFIVQAPLGLISSGLIIPLLPLYSKLADSIDRKPLIKKIRQGLYISSISMFGLATILIPNSSNLVELIYKRGVFDQDAVVLVSQLLVAYSIGMPAYLGRDLLVRVFYSLGDAKTPYIFSAYGVILNIFLDWVLTGGPTPWGNKLPFNYGAPGIIFATVIINFITCGLLLIRLKEKLPQVNLKCWFFDLSKIFFSGVISIFLILLINHSFNNGISILFKTIFTSLIGLFTFTAMTKSLKISETNIILRSLKDLTLR